MYVAGPDFGGILPSAR